VKITPASRYSIDWTGVEPPPSGNETEPKIGTDEPTVNEVSEPDLALTVGEVTRLKRVSVERADTTASTELDLTERKEPSASIAPPG